jgi:hypothetical protein
MANPLNGAGGARPPEPGESRTFTSTWPGPSGATKTTTIHRTDRPYVVDLADAYNATLSERARQLGLLWQVTRTGELKLDFTPGAIIANTRAMESRKESDRAKFVRLQLNPRVPTIHPTRDSGV